MKTPGLTVEGLRTAFSFCMAIQIFDEILTCDPSGVANGGIRKTLAKHLVPEFLGNFEPQKDLPFGVRFVDADDAHGMIRHWEISLT